MATKKELEDRIAALEAQVALLQSKLGALPFTYPYTYPYGSPYYQRPYTITSGISGKVVSRA